MDSEARILTSLARSLRTILLCPCFVLVMGKGGFCADRKDGKLLPDGTILVRATVLDTRPGERKDTFISRVIVKEVLVGDPDWLSKTFRAASGAESMQGSGLPMSPPLKEGESALWLVSVSNGTFDGMQGQISFRDMTWPRRKAVNIDTDESDELAAAIAKVSADGIGGDDESILKKYSESTSSTVSAWAIAVLGWRAVDQPDLEAYLEGLVPNPLLSVGAKVQLDVCLLLLKGEAWRDSEARVKLFHELAARDMREPDAMLAIRRLDYLARRPKHLGFEQRQLLEIVRVVLGNARLSLDARKRALAICLQIPQHYDDDGAGFRFLCEQMTQHPIRQVRIGAAESLGTGYGYSTNRAEAIELLLESIEDEEIRRAARKAMSHSVGPRREQFTGKRTIPGGASRVLLEGARRPPELD